MKNYLIALALVFTIQSCDEAEPAADNESTDKEIIEDEFECILTKPYIAEDIDVVAFNHAISKGNVQLIDVRTPNEFEQGTIEGALNMDYNSESFLDQIKTLDKGKPVYLFCQSGGRSQKAKEILVNEAFDTIYNLNGGYGEWSK